jgi:hypothetical protein
VFVIPSRQDNLPNTGLEAHACGTPVVAFAAGGLVDIVDHHITGVLAEPFDPLSLAAAIRWVLEDPQRCRPQLPAAGRAALGSGAGGGVVCGGVRAGCGAGPPEPLWNTLATLRPPQAWDDDAHRQPSPF